MRACRPATVLVATHLARGGRVTLLELPANRTLIVAPHPDDEALAAGGLIVRQRQRGVPVLVVAVTDGEAAYPGWDASLLARLRRGEQATALAVLGVDAGSLVRLGLPDGQVADHEALLAARLHELARPGDVMVVPWRHDRHPDHEASGRAAWRAAIGRGCTLLESLFWAHHQAPPGSGQVRGLVSLALTEDETRARAEAVSAHRSQIARDDGSSILQPEHTGHLVWPVEYYVSEPGAAAHGEAGAIPGQASCDGHR
jgi:LmbE family N-acetylglucosaminyl deacetylase